MKRKILIYLHHPSQYHLFKNAIKKFLKNGHKVIVFAVTKDILTHLLDAEGIQYINNMPVRRRDNKLSMALSVVKQDIGLLKYCLKNRPDIMMGTSAEICHIGRLINIPSLMFIEDDFDVVPLAAKIAYPFAKHILVPSVCSVGKWERKKIAYNGYQKLAYLHPKYFKPSKKIIAKYININRPYFLIRMAKLNAHHDFGIKGLDEHILSAIIQILKNHGDVFISSEAKLPEKFFKYKLEIDYRHIHDVLSFASLFVGDSQSMAVEASILGVPNIRFSDFSGKISVLEELEQKYGLTKGIKTTEPNKLLNTISDYLKNFNLKNEFIFKREKMLADKIDVTSFIVWFTENYPDSAQIMKENPEYQNSFKGK